jgi:hypothetical protein
MPARSMLMPKNYFSSWRGPANDYALLRQTLREQYKSTNNIEQSNSLLPSQRRMDNLDTAFPLALPVSWGTIGSLVILSTIGGLICAYIFNRKQHSFRVNLPHKVICSRCQYFNNNHFLKCAINPSTVLTEQAIDCVDYDPKAEIKQIEQWRRVLLAIRKVFV